MKKVKCPKCRGTGLVPNQYALALERRSARMRAHITMTEVAEKMGITCCHLSLLERGKRNWSPEMTMRHEEAIP